MTFHPSPLYLKPLLYLARPESREKNPFTWLALILESSFLYSLECFNGRVKFGILLFLLCLFVCLFVFGFGFLETGFLVLVLGVVYSAPARLGAWCWVFCSRSMLSRVLSSPVDCLFLGYAHRFARSVW